MHKYLLLIVVAFVVFGCNSTAQDSQVQAIWLDGSFNDWENVPHSVYNLEGIKSYNMLQSVSITNDQDFIYIKLLFNRKINLQNNNEITIWMGTDTERVAGKNKFAYNYTFGSRYGRVLKQVRDDPNSTFRHGKIQLRYMPTFSSNKFEVRLPLNLEINGNSVFQEDLIQLAVTESAEVSFIDTSDDKILSYFLQDYQVHKIENHTDRFNPDDIRVLTYNVFNDGLFERPEIFSRIFYAVKPDIFVLLEMYNHGAEETLNWFSNHYPAAEGQQWYAFSHPGKVTVSRFPMIRNQVFYDDLYSQIDIPGFPNGLLLVNSHLACCDRDSERQEKADALIAEIRDMQIDTEHSMHIKNQTPVILAGDFNLVGDVRQFKTLTHGAISRTDKYGSAYLPDWNQRPFLSAQAYHLTSREIYTWRDDIDHTDEFVPGRLDYVFYSGRLLQIGNNFVMWTPKLSEQQLGLLGLRPDDTLKASDHLPLVTDFRISK